MQIDTSPIIDPSANSTWNTTMDSTLSNQMIPLTPQQMKLRKNNLRYTGDPALLPITSTEFTFLVRFLHQLSCKLNLMFGGEMNDLWNRNDLWGKLSRQILCPPMVSQTFDKSQGVCMLKQDNLGPRICLRVLASYKSAFVIVFSFFLGYLFFNAPSYGFMMLVSTTFFYLLIKSLLSDLFDVRTDPRVINRTG